MDLDLFPVDPLQPPGWGNVSGIREALYSVGAHPKLPSIFALNFFFFFSFPSSETMDSKTSGNCADGPMLST